MTTELDTALDAAIDAIIAPGGQLEVTTATIRGIELPVFKSAPNSMREYLAFFFAANADRTFLVYGDERYSFADIYAQAIRIATRSPLAMP